MRRLGALLLIAMIAVTGSLAVASPARATDVGLTAQLEFVDASSDYPVSTVAAGDTVKIKLVLGNQTSAAATLDTIAFGHQAGFTTPAGAIPAGQVVPAQSFLALESGVLTVAGSATSIGVDPTIVTGTVPDGTLGAHDGSPDHVNATAAAITGVVHNLSPTTLTISGPASAAYDSFFNLTGTISDPGGPVANAGVTLWQNTGTGWTSTGLGAQSTSSGSLSGSARMPAADTQYQWRYAGDADHAASISPSVAVTMLKASTTTSIRTDPHWVQAGGSTDITCQATAGTQPIAPVTLQHESGTAWVDDGTADFNASGETFTVTPTTTTTYRCSFLGTSGYSPSTSDPLTLAVVAGPPSLTMQATPGATVLAGTDATLVGVLTEGDLPAAGEHVTLQRQDASGAAWTSVTTLTTDSSGSVSWTVTPSAGNTGAAYRWSDDVIGISSSAISLAVGTADTPTDLRINSSAYGSVSAGTPVTISGSLGTPATSSNPPVSSFGDAAVPYEPVWLEESTDGGATWIDSSPSPHLTNAQGGVSFTVTPSTTTEYQLVYDGSDVYNGNWSDSATVIVGQPGRSNTTLGGYADPEIVGSGGSSAVTGTLRWGSSMLAGQTVLLEQSQDDVHWTLTATVVSTAGDGNTNDGNLRATVTPTASTDYRWRFTGTPSYAPSMAWADYVHVVPITSVATTLSADALDPAIAPGASTTLNGSLAVSGGSLALAQGAPITLEQSTDGGRSWSTVATETTYLTEVHAAVAPTRTTLYRWHYLGTNGYDGGIAYQPSYSPSVTVTVSAPAPQYQLSIRTPRLVKKGMSLVVSGTLTPAAAGTKVTIVVKTQHGSQVLGTATVAANGHFTFTKKQRKTGRFTILAQALGVASPPASYKVK